MNKYYQVLLCLLLSVQFGMGQTPGVSIYYEQYAGDDREYIEYIPGNLPIIISAPHGGVKQSGSTVGGIYYPDDDPTLPDRTCGTNERDDNTDILAREITAKIFDQTGCYPHVIISNLHRSKLDPNREEGQAACGDSDAEDHWAAFHSFIDDASLSVEANWGKGLFIDLHGQSHSIPRIELGYNITANQLNNSDLNSQSIIDNSTINHLVSNNLLGESHNELVRGEHSLGEILQDAPGTFYAAQNYPGCTHNGTNGYRAIPSDTDTGNSSCDDTQPHEHAYFDGDFYNNRRHGSGPGADDGSNTGTLVGGGGQIDGIMSEVNRRVRDLGTYNGAYYDNKPQTLVPFAVDYAGAMIDFIDFHYNDFSNFHYNEDCDFVVGGEDLVPIVSGLEGGTFTVDPNLSIDSVTGVIDLDGVQPGEYDISYTLGDCAYYKSSQTIIIKDGSVAYVDHSSVGNQDGTSWEDAYVSLEAALNSNCIYDTIKIAEGVYIPNTSNRSYIFSVYENLIIIGSHPSGGGSPDPSVYPTTISGDIGINGDNADNLYHIFNIGAGISNLHFLNLRLEDGNANASGDNGRGAAIHNRGNIILGNIIASENSSINPNEIIYNNGMIEMFGELTLSNNN